MKFTVTLEVDDFKKVVMVKAEGNKKAMAKAERENAGKAIAVRRKGSNNQISDRKRRAKRGH